jgi:hypothetical protein
MISADKRFKDSREAIDLFYALNNFLRAKHDEGTTFAVWVYEKEGEAPIVHYTAFPDYRPK